MARPELTIVLPVYNEEARIESAMDDLFEWLSGDGADMSGDGRWEVLVVDDGSTDRTVAILEARPEAQEGAAEGAPPLRVLRRPHMGKGATVTAGVLAAEGENVLFADADMATPPHQIPLIVEALKESDVALGSRVQPGGSDHRRSQPLYRRAFGGLYRRLAGLWVTGDIPDTQCGFKGFRRPVAQAVFSRLRTHGLSFDAEIIYLARRLGVDIAVVPIEWHDVGGSRIRLSMAAAAYLDLLRIPFLHRDVRPSD